MTGTSTSTGTSTLNGAPTAFDALKEIRLAVVTYGGISLAIYINGIVQEMLKFVRATAPLQDLGSDRPLLDTPQSSEKIYRKLGQIVGDPDNTPASLLERLNQSEPLPIRTRFVIDVLSGTSAGGINAIFLAKALANNQQLKGLEQLWISRGDIEQLINDGKSLTPRLLRQNPPLSLLNSSRMYLELLSALDGMDQKDPVVAASPLVEQLDLFSTTTDIRGLTLPIVLTDGIVYERRHRNVFHFQHSAADQTVPGAVPLERTAFRLDSNPFLAYAARCTSAFPFAFEPMQLSDVFDVLRTATAHLGQDYTNPDTTYWERFYQDYLSAQQTGPRSAPFQFRSFGDGGYLDNKPFSYAIDAILTRHSDLPVERKLVYIEPSPEELSVQAVASDRPNALENSLAALLVLPRYETIREDLERVLKRNIEIERLDRVVNEVMSKGFLRGPDSGRDPQTWLGGAQNDYGGSYATYEALKLSSVTDELTDLFAKAFRIDTESALGSAIRTLGSEWRNLEFPHFADRRRFLLDFDIQFRLRRIRYARQRLQDEYAEPTVPSDILDAERAAYKREYREELQRVKAKLGPPYRILLSLLQTPQLAAEELDRGIFPPDEMALVVAPPGDLNRWPGLQSERWVGERTARGAGARARYVLQARGRRANVTAVATKLGTQFRPVTQKASQDTVAALAEIPGLTRGARDARTFAATQYQDFERYDSAAFPITFGTNIDDTGPISVHRISPDDADAREDDILRGRPKLRGHALGAFGGFLDENWRRNDILWGRLDGAERLIGMVLPGSDPSTANVRRQLVDQAHEEIVVEFLELDAARRVGWKRELRDFIAKVPFQPTPELVARSTARATTVVGDLLEGIADKHSFQAKRLFARMAFVGRLGWNFVEVSVPRTPRELFGTYWMQLLMLFCGMLIVVAALSREPSLIGLAILLTVATATLYALRELLRRYLRGQVVLAPAVMSTMTVLATAGLTMLVVYFLTLIGFVGSAPSADPVVHASVTQRLWNGLLDQSWLYPLMACSAAVTLVAGMLTANLLHRANRLNHNRNVVSRLKFARYWIHVLAALGLPFGPVENTDAAPAAVADLRAAVVRAAAIRGLATRAIRMDYVFATAYALMFISIGIWIDLVRPSHFSAPLITGTTIGFLGVLAGALNGQANSKAIELLEQTPPDNPGLRLADSPFWYNMLKWLAVLAAIACGIAMLFI